MKTKILIVGEIKEEISQQLLDNLDLLCKT